MTFFLLWNTKKAYLELNDLKTFSFVFHRREKVIQIVNDMRASKWWQDFYFWVLSCCAFPCVCVCVCVCGWLLYQIPLSKYMRRWFNRPTSLPLLHLSCKGQQLPGQPIPLFYLKRIAVLMCMLKHKLSSAVCSLPRTSFLFEDLLSDTSALSDEPFCRRLSRRWTRSFCSPSKYKARKGAVSPMLSICCAQRSNSLFVWHLF